MSETTMTIEAVFENGTLRPVEPLSLLPEERVTITIRRGSSAAWPGDTAEIYQEIQAEDRKLAEAMWPGIRSTFCNVGR